MIKLRVGQEVGSKYAPILVIGKRRLPGGADLYVFRNPKTGERYRASVIKDTLPSFVWDLIGVVIGLLAVAALSGCGREPSGGTRGPLIPVETVTSTVQVQQPQQPVPSVSPAPTAPPPSSQVITCKKHPKSKAKTCKCKVEKRRKCGC